jgi:4-amino-4-deoxy-L-arabinose transferase-like glycosyltransferase
MRSADAAASKPRAPAGRFPWALFVAALAVRLLYLLQSRDFPAFGRPLVDALTHHRLAEGIAAGQGVAELLGGNRPFFEPLFLAAVYAFAGPSVLAAQLVQAVVGAGTCVLTWAVGRRLADERVGRIAGGVVALYGPLVFFESELMEAGWAAFWTTALLGLLLRAEHEVAARDGLLLGACAALLTLTRPDFGPVVALLALWFLWRHALSVGSAARGLRRTWPALLGFLLLAGPVAWASWQSTGRIALGPATGALNLYIGNNEKRCETLTLRPGEEFLALMYAARDAGYEGSREQETFYRSRFLAYVKNEPAHFLVGLTHKAAQYANGREVPRNLDLYIFREWSSLLAASVWKVGRFGFPWGLLFPLALVGLWIQRRRLPVPVWILVGAQPALLILVFVASRYRVPLVPVWAVLAAMAGVSGFDAIRARRWRSAAAVAAAALGLAVLTSLPGPSCEERLDYRAEMYALLARQTLNEGDLDGTEALLAQALATDPSSPDANFRMGRVWLARHAPERALRHFDAALAKGPEQRALTQRCRAFLQLGELARARADCEAALRLRPDEPLADLLLGDIEYAEGDSPGARQRWQRLSRGSDAMAQQARARLTAFR